MNHNSNPSLLTSQQLELATIVSATCGISMEEASRRINLLIQDSKLTSAELLDIFRIGELQCPSPVEEPK